MNEVVYNAKLVYFDCSTLEVFHWWSDHHVVPRW